MVTKTIQKLKIKQLEGSRLKFNLEIDLSEEKYTYIKIYNCFKKICIKLMI